MVADTPASPPVADAKLSTKGQVGKNLVVCIDGTSNQFGRSNTNVVKLFDSIDLKSKKKKQLAYYSSGIGTRTKSQAFLDRMKDKLDMVVAWSVDENIKEAYGWLAEKYEMGDDIFLFGFSRGAYQVRALAGMIHEVGLIRTQTERQVHAAYKYYEAIRPGKPEARQIARKFKDTFCWDDLTVHFIGAWDTVSSVGLIRGDVSLAMSSPAHYVRHALALDECRVKFIPEYFRKTSFNSDAGDDVLDVQRVYTLDDNQSNDRIKEVWFAGSHSDVGGLDRPGNIHQAGNISLLWMYREAAVHGLDLRPTDVTWGPDDIDFGTKNSMSPVWRFFEYLAIKHQVSYGGIGSDARRMHRSEPRLIMPHQKVHASILYANAYRPGATRGRGFDISMITPEDKEPDKSFWETDLFGDMEAQELMKSLGRQRMSGAVCLEKLLFMLRFNEGKRRVRSISDWQKEFQKIIDDNEYAPFIRLVAIVAYYEACDLQEYPAQPRMPSDAAFAETRKFLSSILVQPRHQYNRRMVALLNTLTRHSDLRKYILTEDVLGNFVKLVDFVANASKGRIFASGQREDNFVQVMKGLNSLLQYKGPRKFIIRKLGEKYSNSDGRPRLSRVLEVNDPHFLIAALRMMLTLVRFPKAKALCSAVMPRICELAKKRGGIIGPLAAEIWLAYDPEQKLSLDNARIQANIASALVRKNFDTRNFVAEESGGTDSGLASIFGLHTTPLNEEQKKLIRELKIAAQKGSPRVRTTMTMTLLKLCESPDVRRYLCDIDLVKMFVDQLQDKDSALLAAYALATCLKHSDMLVKDNELLPKHIVGMLQKDYFDDAIGQVEGLTIFVYLMQNSALRDSVMNHNLMEVLGGKAGKGQLENILSGLLHKDKDKDKDSTEPCIQNLVEESLKFLRNPEWKTQKIGVTILTALAQTRNGEKIVESRIPEIILMILPEGYQDVHRPSPYQSSTSVLRNQKELVANAAQFKESRLRAASVMMGPACALQSLQQLIRKREEYRSLKQMYLSRALFTEGETAPWRVNAPTKSEVTTMLAKMMTAVEGELSQEDLMWFGDTLPPGVQHWGRAAMFLGYTAAGTVLFPVALGACIGITALTLAALVVGSPFYLSNLVRRSHDRKTKSNRGTRENEYEYDSEPDDEEECEPIGDDDSARHFNTQTRGDNGDNGDNGGNREEAS